MDLDPRRLQTLLAVHREGGVSGAAELLRLTPSAVSQQLRALERDVGIALFDRGERAVQLTAAGLALVGPAEQIERALDVAATEMGERQAAIAGTVAIGAFQSAIKAVVAPALMELRHVHPQLEVRVKEVPDAQVARLVRSGELDLGTVEVRQQHPTSRGLAEVPLLDDPWVVVCPALWTERTVRQLASRTWISTFDDARTDALSELGEQAGFVPTVLHRCVEYPSVLALVAAGAGAAVVPSLALQLFGSSGLRTLPVPGLGRRTITVLHRSTRKEPTAAVRAVIEALAAAAGQL
jgi:DNA-binding transcriptional LysR family regulator